MAGMFDHGAKIDTASTAKFKSQLHKVYGWYTGGFLAFIIVLAILEQMGLPKNWIGFIFLLATVGLYAGIGIMSRTAEVSEYYVAGRRVPAFFNGMATGADWMSAASFIGMAGTLFLSGFDGLAVVMGWTGGYCLVALFLAPYLRKFGQFTIPDFLGARYGGNIVRTIGIISAIVCSFVYVVAQIYGVGLITSRFTGLEFGIGVFVGLKQISVGEENNLNIRVYGELGGIEWHQKEPNTMLVKWLDQPMQVFRTSMGYLGAAAKAAGRTPPAHPEGYLEAFANIYKNFANHIRAVQAGKKLPKGDPALDYPRIEDGVRGMAFIEAVVKSSKKNAAWTKLDV